MQMHPVPEASNEKGGAKHEQEVAQNGADEAQLHEAEEALVYRIDAHHQFRDVSKCGVQQASQGL